MTCAEIFYIVLIDDYNYLERDMHELGVLRQVVKTVSRVAEQNNIRSIKHIALEVGENSGFVPHYLTRLFPAAADGCPRLQGTELQIVMVSGSSLIIKEIGY